MVGEEQGQGDAASPLGIDGLVEPGPIGEGGNAIVYRAYQPSLDRHVAVKVLKGLVDDDARRRFDRERKAMGRLSEHDGIVTVYESGFTARGEPYLVMPLLPSSLEDDLRSGPLPWIEAVEVMTQVCETVGIAHDRGVVHRDLKPGNIMRAPTGRPLVADFGIARLMDASASFKSTAITLTPAYSPPEALEATLASARADVYSLGATTFALIAGHAPFVDPTGESSLLVLMRRILDDPVPDLRPAIPDALQAVLERSMAKDPAERYDDAAQLGQALRGVIAGTTATPEGTGAPRPTPAVSSPPPGAPPALSSSPSSPPSNRQRALLIGALVCSVAIVAALALTVGRSRDSEGDTFDAATEPAVEGSPATSGDDASAAGPTSSAQDDPAPTPAVDATTPPDPTVATAEQPPAPVAGGRSGPSTFQPYATTVLGGDDEPWTVVPRGQETIISVDSTTLGPAEAVDLGFFAPIVTVGEDWLAGAGTEGQLGVIDLDTSDVVRIELENRARHLATEGDALWVVTAADDGSDAMVHRFDRQTLTEEAATRVDDFVLYFDVAGDRVWTAAGSTIKAFETRSLALVIDTSTGIGPIDDIDAFGDVLWVSGGVFDPELADQELARGAVARLDAATGAASPVQTLTDGLSIFERAAVAATDGGAWVTIETTNEAFFVHDDGTLGPTLELPDDVKVAEVIGGALWVLAGGSGSGQLWAIPQPMS